MGPEPYVDKARDKLEWAWQGRRKRTGEDIGGGKEGKDNE